MTMLLAIAGILIALDAIALLMAVGALRQGSGGMSLSTIAYGGAALIGSIVLLVLGNLSESSLLAALAIGLTAQLADSRFGHNQLPANSQF
jgi:hypothetical protein